MNIVSVKYDKANMQLLTKMKALMKLTSADSTLT